MSYDLRLGVKVEGADIIAVIGEPEYPSPTYNLGKMFRACTGWDFKQGEWYRVSEVWPKIEHGISELRMHSTKYKHLEPENGWGTVSSAIKTLESLTECIRQTVDGNYSWNKIPPDKLWVCW